MLEILGMYALNWISNVGNILGYAYTLYAIAYILMLEVLGQVTLLIRF